MTPRRPAGALPFETFVPFRLHLVDGRLTIGMVNQTQTCCSLVLGYFSCCEKMCFFVNFCVWFPELRMVVLLPRLQDGIDVSFHSCLSSSEQPTNQCLTLYTVLPMQCWDFGPRDPSPRNPHVDFFCVDFAQQSCLAQKCVLFCRFVSLQIVFTKGTKCDMATSALSKQHVI